MSHSEYDPDPRNGCSGLWVKCEAAGGAGLARSLCQEGEREGGEVVCEMAAVSTHILCTPAVLPWKHQLLEAWIMCVCVALSGREVSKTFIALLMLRPG